MMYLSACGSYINHSANKKKRFEMGLFIFNEYERERFSQNCKDNKTDDSDERCSNHFKHI